MRSHLLIAVVLWSTSFNALCQVDEIVKASVETSGKDRDRSSSGAFATFEFIHLTAQALIQWQSLKLSARDEIPGMVGLEISGVTAIQPSTYYIVHPRFRANWGLFSTDFRFNYLIEEDIDGAKHIRTDDWQIVQMNIVTSRRLGFSIGYGFIHEAFNEGAFYPEWTAGLRARPTHAGWWIHGEFRLAEPRREMSANIHYPVLQGRRATLFAVAGGAFQEYYRTVNVWGLQGGLTLRIF